MKEEFLQAKLQNKDEKIRKMGLNNTVCLHPTHWCRTHQIWMDEKSIETKHCTCKVTADQMSTYRCPHLIPVEEFPQYAVVYGK